ncbi:MAG: hypothetical protein ACRDOK_17000, partial [Streptosporangiaceae bacterium]
PAACRAPGRPARCHRRPASRTSASMMIPAPVGLIATGALYLAIWRVAARRSEPQRPIPER